MNDVIGIAWFKDELTYRRALAIFTDSENMPATFEDWKALVGRECEEIKGGGNIAIRADIDPETFTDWCNLHGFRSRFPGENGVRQPCRARVSEDRQRNGHRIARRVCPVEPRDR